MKTMLVRFCRSHGDDDDHVLTRFGSLTPENYLQQLRDELDEGGFPAVEEITLVPFEGTGSAVDRITDADEYLIYARIPVRDNESHQELASRIQSAYDLGAAAGFYQIIE